MSPERVLALALNQMIHLSPNSPILMSQETRLQASREDHLSPRMTDHCTTTSRADMGVDEQDGHHLEDMTATLTSTPGDEASPTTTTHHHMQSLLMHMEEGELILIQMQSGPYRLADTVSRDITHPSRPMRMSRLRPV